MTPEKLQHIAKVCYEAIRRQAEMSGDSAIPIWDDAPEWSKGDIIDQISFIADASPNNEIDIHEQWMSGKAVKGWIHGVAIDEVQKTHPSIVPFSELPESEVAKYRLTRALVDAMKWF